MTEDKFLVTGATGSLGEVIIQSLLIKGIKPSQLRVLVRKPEQANEFQSRGMEVAIGNYDSSDSLRLAMQGIDRLMFISSSEVANRVKQHQNVVRAAQATGVGHIYYTSFARKSESENSPLWIVAESHIKTEQWIKESDIPYTILKNNLYMDFIPGFIGDQVLERNVIYLPAENGRASVVLRSELAEATAQVLLEDGHAGKTYEFSNPSSFDYPEVAGILSELSGKSIQYISPTAEEYRSVLASAGLPPEAIAIFSGFAVAQAEGELEEEISDLASFLGRNPTSIATFLMGVYGQNID